MAMPGRKPKPAALRVLEGNPGHRPVKEAVKARPGAPKPPRWALIFTPPSIPGPLEDGDEAARKRRVDEIAAAGRLAATAKEMQRDAAAEWRRVVPALDELGLVAGLDGALLTDYCVCWAQLQACLRTLSREGMAVQGERGVQKHPCLTAATALRTQLKAYMSELGLGPSSRGRMQLPGGADGQEESPWDI